MESKTGVSGNRDSGSAGDEPAKRKRSPAVTIDGIDVGRLPRTIFSLIWPVVLQETAFGLFAMVITFLVGKFGAPAITAVGLGENIVHLPEVAFAGISVGGTAIVARHIGAGEPREANRTLRQALLLAFILGVIFAILWWFLADWWLDIYKARPEVVELARAYIRINAPFTVFFFLLYAGEALMRGAGDTRTPMIVTVTIEVIGVLLAAALIRGFWIFPEMGVIGAAIARAVVSVLGAGIIITMLIKGRGAFKYDIRNALKFDFGVTKRIARVGLPVFAEMLQMRAAMTIYQILISSLGTVTFAAHSLTMRVEEFAFMPAWGFSVAATTLVGQSLGAKRPDLAEKSALLAQRYCLIAMVAMGLVTFVFGERLMDIFIDDPEVIRLGALGLKIWALAMPGMAINQTLAGGLRGAGDTRWVLLITTVGTWTMRVGGGWLLVHGFDMGVVGAWTGAVADHTVRAAIVWWRFHTGKWKTIRV